MSVARINIKNMDYFKFRKLIIDGSRDDYGSCSKEVRSFCDCVQAVNFRDEQFDDVTDRRRFAEICLYYKQILASKRIDPQDMRIKSGWWGDHKNSYSAGKLKPSVLKDVLIQKSTSWFSRHGMTSPNKMADLLDGPGLYVLKHRDRQCFQYVGFADRIFVRFAEKMRQVFDGTLQEPLSALLIVSMASDWEFYFTPVQENDDERLLRILKNDLILKHDSIWPHGLNFRLHIDSLLEVSEFRRSCLRYNWPPCEVEGCLEDGLKVNADRIRKQIFASQEETIYLFDKAVSNAAEGVKSLTTPNRSPKKQPSGQQKAQPPSIRPEWKDSLENLDSEAADDVPVERPASPMSDISHATYVVEQVDGTAVKMEYQSLATEESGEPNGADGVPGAAPGSASRPVAFMVPLDTSSPRKVRPGTVTLASKKERMVGRQAGANVPVVADENMLLDNKTQSKTSTVDKSPLPGRKTSGLIPSGREGGKENAPSVANSAQSITKAQKADLSNPAVKVGSGATNANRSPRSRIQRPNSANKTKPKIAKR